MCKVQLGVGVHIDSVFLAPAEGLYHKHIKIIRRQVGFTLLVAHI